MQICASDVQCVCYVLCAGGHMHDIVTVTTSMNTELNGPSSSQYSWFPGYRWTTAVCSVCAAHVGWRYGSKALASVRDHDCR